MSSLPQDLTDTHFKGAALVVVTLLKVLDLGEMTRIPLLLLCKLCAQRFLTGSAHSCHPPEGTHDRLGGDLKVAV
jgi:hypothetical protein